MHEINTRTAGALPAVQSGLDYIPVCSDPRGIYLPAVCEEDPEPEESCDQDKQQPRMTLLDVMEKVGAFAGGLASLGIVCVLGYMVLSL